MDVGADNFHFALEDKNGLREPTQTFREPKTTELHVDSLDRYKPSDFVSNSVFANFPNQSLAKGAGQLLLNSSQSGTNVKIDTGRALLNGYFSRVAITQMNLNYRVPTVVTGVNDLLFFKTFAPTAVLRTVTIPQGYYTYASMATTLQALMLAAAPELGVAFTVTAPNNLNPATPATSLITGFTFDTGNGAITMVFLYGGSPGTALTSQVRVAKTFRMLGMNRSLLGFTPEFNTGGQPTADGTPYQSATGGVPNFLPTDYVDVVSQNLSNYKDAKDSNSTVQAPGCVLARIYLTECPLNWASSTNGVPVDATVLGFTSMTFCKTWQNPNWSQWSPNQTINTIDVRLLDMWGEQVFWTSSYPTEWSATLTLTE
tara:strand:+ start:1067 stop:2182 length:1116 start_codon:yes stop_codon:yes gene_type:complete